MAGLQFNRSVKVVLTRKQMFTFGHRPQTRQYLHLSCDVAGRLTSIRHEAFAETSRQEEYVEDVVNWSGFLYACPNVTLSHKLVPVDRFTPLEMREPGIAIGAVLSL